MPDLATTYMGLPLRNPVIVASSSLTETADKIQQCCDAGAGAVVMKSLFEEQIQSETEGLQNASGFLHTEAADYLNRMTSELTLTNYLKEVEQAKKAVDIPVITSLNCSAMGSWMDFAKRIEEAGSDGLELNIYVMDPDPRKTSEEIEQRYIDILRGVKDRVKIPIAVKIGSNFTNLARMVDQLSIHGADAVVIFNRYYRINIEIDTFSLKHDKVFSTPDEIADSLRWMSILSGRIRECDLAATTGIHDGEAVIKQILAGATAVQVCSVLYERNLGVIREMQEFMEDWLTRHSFPSLSRIRGMMSQKKSDDPAAFARVQYIKTYLGIAAT